MDKRTSILIGAGFSKSADLPLARDVEVFFIRDNSKKILAPSTGQYQWLDFANETEKHNGQTSREHYVAGYCLNAIVDYYIKEKEDSKITKCFISL